MAAAVLLLGGRRRSPRIGGYKLPHALRCHLRGRPGRLGGVAAAQPTAYAMDRPPGGRHMRRRGFRPDAMPARGLLRGVGDELKRVPKLGGPGRGKKDLPHKEGLLGREATGIPCSLAPPFDEALGSEGPVAPTAHDGAMEARAAAGEGGAATGHWAGAW